MPRGLGMRGVFAVPRPVHDADRRLRLVGLALMGFQHQLQDHIALR